MMSAGSRVAGGLERARAASSTTNSLRRGSPGGAQPVVDARAVAFAQLAANVQAEAGAAAARREERLEQIGLDLGRDRRAVARARAAAPAPSSRAVEPQRIAPGAWLAWRRALSSRLTSTRRRCSASKTTPTGSIGSSTCSRRFARRGRRRRCAPTRCRPRRPAPRRRSSPACCSCARRHLHHVVDDALEALDVVGHHAHQLALRRVGARLRAAARWPARSPPAGCGSRARCRPRRGPSRPASPAGCAPARCARPRGTARRTPRSPAARACA